MITLEKGGRNTVGWGPWRGFQCPIRMSPK